MVERVFLGFDLASLTDLLSPEAVGEQSDKTIRV
jgi:hypothetical protein